mmetsp:Transcript_83493/g.236676  ORF Transcript_83493/g.236676 Transcript_83493/m.236676 type:complete len:225 (-) Transcript_83493:1506-2180(-)
MSAIFVTLFGGSFAMRQTRRNVPPLFLLTDPWNSSTTPWTISAIWLTNFMTFSWRTSVAVLKSRIRTVPTMQSTRDPATMAFTLESEPFMFWLTMLAPASPKPSARREPSLMMVFSRITVSMSSVGFSPLQKTSILSLSQGLLRSACDFFISSRLNSSFAMFMACKGLSRIASTLVIIISTGCSTSVFASLEKRSDATHKTMHTKTVVKRLRQASCLVTDLRSK